MVASWSGMAQDQRSLRMHLINGNENKVSWTIRNGRFVKVKTPDGSHKSGFIRLKSESLFMVGKDSFRLEDVLTVKDWSLTMVAIASVPVSVFYPSALYGSLGLFIFEELATSPGDNDYLSIDRLKKTELNKKLKNQPVTESLMAIRDSIQPVTQKNMAIRLRRDSIQLVRKTARSEHPHNYLFIGTDLEKLPVRNFAGNIDYYFQPYFGFSAQFGYKPQADNVCVYSSKTNFSVDFASSQFMFRLNPVITFINVRDSSRFFFIGPSVYYKVLNGDQILSSYNSMSFNQMYISTLWHDKEIKGIGIRGGISSKRKIGLSISAELSYRNAEVHDFMIRFNGDRIHTDRKISYFNIDASIALRLKVRKHR